MEFQIEDTINKYFIVIFANVKLSFDFFMEMILRQIKVFEGKQNLKLN
jgi:hypothetical protein